VSTPRSKEFNDDIGVFFNGLLKIGVSQNENVVSNFIFRLFSLYLFFLMIVMVIMIVVVIVVMMVVVIMIMIVMSMTDYVGD